MGIDARVPQTEWTAYVRAITLLYGRVGKSWAKLSETETAGGSAGKPSNIKKCRGFGTFRN
jgi:hypothetical protein